MIGDDERLKMLRAFSAAVRANAAARLTRALYMFVWGMVMGNAFGVLGKFGWVDSGLLSVSLALLGTALGWKLDEHCELERTTRMDAVETIAPTRVEVTISAGRVEHLN